VRLNYENEVRISDIETFNILYAIAKNYGTQIL
jgi:hypothetical protein